MHGEDLPFLDPADDQEDDDDHEDQPQSSGRSITPVSTMRPSWQRAKQS